MDDKMSEIEKRLFAFTHPLAFGVYSGWLVLRRDILVMAQYEGPVSIGHAAMLGEMVTVWSRPK